MSRVAEGADEESYADIGYHRWVSQCGAQFIPCVSERLYHERYQQPDKLEDDKERSTKASPRGSPGPSRIRKA